MEKINTHQEHTLKRFEEKFPGRSPLKNEDYVKLCNICQKEEEENVLFKQTSRHKTYKMIVLYKNIQLWCVFSKKRNVILTVYPTRKKDIKKIKSL